MLVLGSRNRKKCKEMAELIAPPWEPSRALERLLIRSVEDFAAAPEVVEDADTFAGNARKKASELARALAAWVVADDSGLTVDALGGAPGVFSARYAGEPTNDEANNRKVLEALAETPDDRRGAAFRCALALADPSGTIRLEAEGACRGRLTRDARGPAGLATIPVPDSRIPQDLRRAEPARQASAQPSGQGVCRFAPRPGTHDRARRTRFKKLRPVDPSHRRRVGFASTWRQASCSEIGWASPTGGGPCSM